MTRAKLTRFFLWLSVVGSGIGLGAKLFDLVVIAGAWGASPPTSLGLMPYGPRYPLNPGDFFQPLGALMAVAIYGALIAGWKTNRGYRKWLILPAVTFIIIWAITPTVFWPMIRELYGAGTGRLTRDEAELLLLVRRWFAWDWFRTGLIAAGLLAHIRAISMPYPAERD